MDWSAFYGHVRPKVKGCPELKIDQALREAAIEFCQRTHVWQATLDPVKSKAKVGTYDLDVPSDARLVKLLAVQVGTEGYGVVTPAVGRATQRRQLGDRLAWVSSTRAELLLNPAPSAAGLNIVCDAVLMPRDDATGIDDDIGAQHKNDIALGALRRLLEMRQVDWSDPTQASEKLGEFETRVHVVHAQVARGFSSARVPRRSNFF